MAGDIPLSGTDITEDEIEAVTETLRSGRLSIGPRQRRFEQLVADRAERGCGIAVSSGTAGLHLVLEALGIGEGDEVITTPFSFIASANAILYTGARPVFVDIDPASLNMHPGKVEQAITDRTRAILAVHAFGNPAGIDQLATIAQRHEIPLIEDACEAIGARHKGKAVGSFGRAAVFGFYPNKQITTGEGGMIVTDDDRLADLCRSLRNHGRPAPSEEDPPAPFPRLGYNYRLSELHAALGVAQMQRLDEILQRRREAACLYFDKLMTYSDIALPTLEDGTEMSWFIFPVRLTNPYEAKHRDRILTGLRRHEIGCAAYFPPIHLQPVYRQRFGYKAGDFPAAESVAARTIALPFFTRIEPTQVELVCLTLEVMLQRERLLRPDRA